MGSETCFFGYEISADLYERCVTTLREVKSHPDINHLNVCAASNLIGLTDTGLAAYYEIPVSMTQLSPMLRKTADAGVHTVQKAVHVVIRKIFDARPRDQLAFMAEYMEHMLCTSVGNAQRHFLCFELDPALFALAGELLARVRTDTDLDAYRADIISALERLIENGLNAYYSIPVGQVNLGKFMRTASDFGINTAHKGIIAILHKLLGAMSHAELIPLAAYFETLLHADVTSYYQQQRT